MMLLGRAQKEGTSKERGTEAERETSSGEARKTLDQNKGGGFAELAWAMLLNLTRHVHSFRLGGFSLFRILSLTFRSRPPASFSVLGLAALEGIVPFVLKIV
eukprot:747875-Pleurochrysis_carterae.AAC.1